MAYIIETPNPFKPLTDIRRHTVASGITIRDWLKLRFGDDFIEFASPTICVVNGKPLLRRHWGTYHVQPTDVVNFLACSHGITLLIIAIVLAVASIAIALFLGPAIPDTPGALPESDPVFTTKGQGNAIRLGEPIEVNYGRNRIFPSYAARPYFQYEDNDQFQYALFCIGQGFYEILDGAGAIKIGDTDINSFQEVQYEIVEPGDSVSLFPTNVYTAPEAGGQEMLGPNEDDYTGDGWTGPFPAVGSGSDGVAIQVDLVFPRGLYFSNNDGGLTPQSVTVQIQAREIDDAGDPLGSYGDLFGGPFTITGRTTTPQRRTYSQGVAAARYEVRVRRTNNRTDGHRYGNKVEWEGLRSFVNDDQNFGDVTLLAVKIRATNNLNSQTQQRFNIECTRKLIQHQSDGFTSTPIATRSIIWAFVDIFRGAYGGRVTDASYYDWDVLEGLVATYDAREDNFDWSFRDPITVWEAARTIARAGRAVPLITGSLISMVRDGALTTPVAMFTKENMIEGSFSLDVKLWDQDEFDSVRVEYTEQTTGFKQESILCTLPGGTTATPRDVRLVGVQNRAQAYHEGLYIRAGQVYLRENISFETGLEGYLPSYGDLIIVAIDVPRWSTNGYVVHGEVESNGAWQVWLSEPVAFEVGKVYQIYFTNATGDVLGPYTCDETDELNQVQFTLTGLDLDFLETGLTEPVMFTFGEAGQINKFCRVVKVTPTGSERIRITAVNEDARVHSFDSVSTPAFENLDNVPVKPDLPEVENLKVQQLNESILSILASWKSAFGADFYIVQQSIDGTDWDNVGTTTRASIQWQVRPGTLYIRVAGVGLGQGPWSQEVISIGNLSGLDLIQAFVLIDWTIEWLELLNALSYDVKVYDNTSPTAPVQKGATTNILFTADRTFSYDLDDALADDNVNRNMLVTVTPKFADQDGTPTELEVVNAVPSPPTSLQLLSATQDSDATDMEYTLSWSVPAEDDLIGVRVWLEAAQGFDPEVETPVLDDFNSAVGYLGITTSLIVSVPFDSFGEHAPYYWRVALFDVWGNEYLTNVSAEQTIPQTSGYTP